MDSISLRCSPTGTLVLVAVMMSLLSSIVADGAEGANGTDPAFTTKDNTTSTEHGHGPLMNALIGFLYMLPSWSAKTCREDPLECNALVWFPCYLYVALIALSGAFACVLILPCLFRACGFGEIGVSAGSYAAVFQSEHGTPCCFRTAQSLSMRGTPCWARLIFSIVGLTVGGLLSYYWLPACSVQAGNSSSATNITSVNETLARIFSANTTTELS
ncbi:uncharacterized protein LOC113213550 [Frankliniella occidentalis]|uniref:Uncharacterized protein LOC113213550 n=1 Tax=Frankliniella occidentalis TaxID=133901 RepID=A0A6J1TCD0_FRAOC|nr:uncharacterized protein LOC113213550 [Frankliniella occidentalis]